MTKLLLIGCSTILLFSCATRQKNNSSLFSAGFTSLHLTDSSRTYKPGSDVNDSLHYRPVDIDIWYPAEMTMQSNRLKVFHLLHLFEQRANYYTASAAGNGFAVQFAKIFSAGFNCGDSSTILNFQTNSFKNAVAVNRPFPVVVYFTAYNGMSYENFSLFESLAQKGFLVVSISSIGRFPGDMTMKYQDLMEQVDDAVIALKEVKKYPNADSSRIGVMGYSWGGLAACAFAGKTKTAQCIVSLDGSEFHHYTAAKDENLDFDSITRTPLFNNMHLSMPYLRLESFPLDAAAVGKDSVFNFAEKLSVPMQVYKIDSAQHEDFGCMSMVVPRAGNCKGNDCFRIISTLTVQFLQQQLKSEAGFDETINLLMDKRIHRK